LTRTWPFDIRWARFFHLIALPAGNNTVMAAFHPLHNRQASIMSDHQDPRGSHDSTLAVAIGGLITVLATIAVLYISGTIHL
jgi:hypothetical protein